MGIHIRPANENDAQEVLRLYGEFTRYLRDLDEEVQGRLTVDSFMRDGFRPGAAFATLVADAPSEALVGYLIHTIGYDAEQAERTLQVVDLYVASSRRKRGIGSQLMSAAGEVASALGAARAYWTVARSNAQAQGFFRRFGADAVDVTYMVWES
ncbi:MAG: GNAT family N-acetyltransferase [Pseudomonadota bacterium]